MIKTETACLFSIIALQVACAGPSTPFGADYSFQVPATLHRAPATATPESTPEITFYPPRQFLTSPHDIRVVISGLNAPLKKDYLQFQWGTKDVTARILARSEVRTDPTENKLEIKIPAIRLKEKDNRFSVFYDPPAHPRLKSSYPLPTCDYRQNNPAKRSLDFSLAPQFNNLVHRVSRNHQTNPSLMMGLIAQESSFDKNALSWAKALGLTQVTPLAEHEILKHREWQQYPGLNRMPVVAMKLLIAQNKVNGKNEWRLDPEKSIEGGAVYLEKLHRYWEEKKTEREFADLLNQSPEEFTKILLASYNSGHTRVRKAVQRLGQNWLQDESLEEARKYVYRVTSYCYHFSQPEIRQEEAL